MLHGREGPGQTVPEGAGPEPLVTVRLQWGAHGAEGTPSFPCWEPRACSLEPSLGSSLPPGADPVLLERAGVTPS